jgi:hypothetical protein
MLPGVVAGSVIRVELLVGILVLAVGARCLWSGLS